MMEIKTIDFLTRMSHKKLTPVNWDQLYKKLLKIYTEVYTNLVVIDCNHERKNDMRI